MISLKGIEKIYKTPQTAIPVLRGVSLDIEKGQIFGVLGRAGAGKSTLVRCINLLERPDSGIVMVERCNLSTMDTEALRLARRNIGMIFEHFNLMASRTVYDNIALPLEFMGASKAEIDNGVRPVLELAGLTDKTHAYPSQLSNSQKQRVAIARALVHKPKILLCDEATRGLESKAAQGILQLLREINQKLQLTIVVMTQDIEVIKSICHEVAVLHQGEIVEQASVLELCTAPKSDIAKEFIKNVTRLEMPNALRRRIRMQPTENCNAIVRVSFLGESIQETLMAQVIQQFGFTVNIIQAHLETIANQSVGVMVVEVMGDLSSIQKAVEFLAQKNLHIEVLGYVLRSA